MKKSLQDLTSDVKMTNENPHFKRSIFMKYGYFDRSGNEYVITNPKTPTPWMNYLGNGGFGGLISATAGGLTFDGDPSNRRMTRYRFQGVPIDRPGRYIYIKDCESGDYFTPMWQPVQRDMQFYECRHGFGYTKISGKYMDISSATTYFVPLGKRFEIWKTTVKNESDKERILKIFTYVEFSFPRAEIDTLCHWSCMTFKTSFDGKKLLIDPASSHFPHKSNLMTFFGSDLDIIGYDTDQSVFIGSYNSESNPCGVESGECKNTLIEADSCIGVLCSQIVLRPGESKSFINVLGACSSYEESEEFLKDALSNCDNALVEIKNKWEKTIDCLTVDTPDDEVNLMLNSWHPYQANTTFDWSRFISYYERGVDRGFGFRDSMQDVLGIMHSSPEKAKERIKLLLSIQNSTGDALSVYYPATKKAQGGGRSDDHLWSILSVCNYVRETGNSDFLFESVPYHDGGEGTVLEHLEKGIDFTLNHLGRHGIPDMLESDWDDSLSWMNIERNGAESVFVFFQLAHASTELLKLYKAYGMTERIPKMQKVNDYCKEKLDTVWDGKWFIRAFTPEGEKFCTDDDEYNKVHLIPQSWAVMSEIVDENRLNTAMDNVMKYLYTDMGLITHYNPSGTYDPTKKSYYAFPAGVRENGGIFFHSNTWAIIALAMLSRNDEAFKCYKASLPCRRNDKADLCMTEPYVYSQTMTAPPSSRAWHCVNSWLTGTASWMYYAATQYILGVRPDYKGLIIDPKIPSDWNGFTLKRTVRGTVCNITVKNGGKNLIVNGEAVNSNTVPYEMITGREVNIELAL